VIEFPHPGVQTWANPHGIRIFRLHYSADPDKTAEWAAAQKAGMTNEADYEQEYEINFSAKLGTLVYNLHEEATLEQSFCIPTSWTRYFGLDPHPVVPHAALWCAADPWGDIWAYRELWPSRIYGLRGNAPEDDNRYSIKQYVETVQWLESADNPENDGHDKHDELIHTRVIDYAARAMGQGFFDEKPEYNFQKRFEELGEWSFKDCIKDNLAGPEKVNEWLKPRDVEQADGSFKPKSKLHIFQDRCPELIHELKTNRFQQLTPVMAERSDPTGKAMAKRNHLTDCLKYLAMAEIDYVPNVKLQSTWKPLVKGINY
jgi:hypothetical protein